MSTLAEQQLAAWTELAEGWKGKDDHTTVHRCADCGLGIYLLTGVDGKTYRYTHDQILSLTVLHLRNFHADLDPDQAGQGL